MSSAFRGTFALHQAILQRRRLLAQTLDFLRRQPRNFNVIVARAGFSTFLIGLTSSYESVYVISLGATTVQLDWPTVSATRPVP